MEFSGNDAPAYLLTIIDGLLQPPNGPQARTSSREGLAMSLTTEDSWCGRIDKDREDGDPVSLGILGGD
jgi:hypothetical protein